MIIIKNRRSVPKAVSLHLLSSSTSTERHRRRSRGCFLGRENFFFKVFYGIPLLQRMWASG